METARNEAAFSETDKHSAWPEAHFRGRKVAINQEMLIETKL